MTKSTICRTFFFVSYRIFLCFEFCSARRRRLPQHSSQSCQRSLRKKKTSNEIENWNWTFRADSRLKLNYETSGKIKFEIESQSLEVTRSKAFDNRIKHRNEWMLFKLRSFNALKVDGNIKYEKCWVTQRRLISLVMSIKENYHKFSDFLELCELLMLSYDAALVIRRFSITLLMS